jgi:hypothetical protein
MTFIKIRRTIWVDFFLNQEQPGVWACEGAWGEFDAVTARQSIRISGD